MNIIIRGLQAVASLIMRGFGGGSVFTPKTYIVCSSTEPDVVDFYVTGEKVRTITSE